MKYATCCNENQQESCPFQNRNEASRENWQLWHGQTNVERNSHSERDSGCSSLLFACCTKRQENGFQLTLFLQVTNLEWTWAHRGPRDQFRQKETETFCSGHTICTGKKPVFQTVRLGCTYPCRAKVGALVLPTSGLTLRIRAAGFLQGLSSRKHCVISTRLGKWREGLSAVVSGGSGFPPCLCINHFRCHVNLGLDQVPWQTQSGDPVFLAWADSDFGGSLRTQEWDSTVAVNQVEVEVLCCRDVYYGMFFLVQGSLSFWILQVGPQGQRHLVWDPWFLDPSTASALWTPEPETSNRMPSIVATMLTNHWPWCHALPNVILLGAVILLLVTCWDSFPKIWTVWHKSLLSYSEIFSRIVSSCWQKIKPAWCHPGCL